MSLIIRNLLLTTVRRKMPGVVATPRHQQQWILINILHQVAPFQFVAAQGPIFQAG